jgi:Holliday junction resolvase
MKPSYKNAEAALADLFQEKGWAVEREPSGAASMHPDLIIRRGKYAYVVEVKAASEGRSDRAIPLLSQAILQAQAYARALKEARPLAVVMVGDFSQPLMERVRRFSEYYAPASALGVVSRGGARLFIGDGLDDLNDISRLDNIPSFSRKQSSYASASNLFSDLNQWMLKVLLAPEIPEPLLAAPREKLRNASELAAAARVSIMSASRLIQLLREEHFLDESAADLRLVRRAELFRRWRAAAHRFRRELPMRFLVPGAIKERLKRLLSNHNACLGLFAAAEAHKLGHVHGVLPYVYVESFPGMAGESWQELVPPSPGESSHLILKMPSAPQSVFRGAVLVDGVKVSDILQVWLDVSEHPSRGDEQAVLIQKKVLGHIIDGDD